VDHDRAARERLAEALTANAAQIEALEREHARIVAASLSSNADDEHDPEGATIAFEREQLTALLLAARRTRADLEAATARLDGGSYGRCERCGGAIAPERLEARPDARTCIDCARAR
jgi:RNA polymerase-binding transcription factor DksA